ncbi:ABC transporter ATP-binding protein [Natrinema salaciae]|uniref:ABC-2 type transport system ATP-binding protein n=1 Tax=Natrinema salaciae TaxID=1186196 RepID=A0A1H9FUB5_9EURY|nr:ABC transporter ATP-binding protein [Natrinema salaciae]SEQ41088.1 ABC-2 type transport system ATP-binding protein [Natrinema salaciae]
MAAIETHGLTKRFGEVTAVHEFDLTVEEGEVFGFLGSNGAGKSTTINMLLDFIRPTAGRASILGYDTQRDPQAIRQRIGVLPEGYQLYDRLTGRQHVEFAVEMHESDDDPDRILDRVGLATDGEKPVSGFSTGMRQRLAIGMALVGDPSVLILDEPSSGLDPNGARELRRIVREESDSGTAVFFSSHILGQVESVCDRIGIIDDGELRKVGTVDELNESVGAESLLVLSVDAVPADPGLIDLDGVTGVERGNGTLRISCSDPSMKATIIDRVEDAGATVTDIDVENRSLEDLFSEYTAEGEYA